MKHDAGAAGGGPMPFASAAAAVATAVPASIEEAASHPQMPRPDQRIPLSTRRVVSTIPRADELRDPLENRPADANANANASDSTERKESTCAPHQPPEHTKWVYPSEQQFYNALRRKGWRPEESTIPDVVRIHNAVNERGWSEVRRWEALRGNDTPPPRPLHGPAQGPESPGLVQQPHPLVSRAVRSARLVRRRGGGCYHC